MCVYFFTKEDYNHQTLPYIFVNGLLGTDGMYVSVYVCVCSEVLLFSIEGKCFIVSCFLVNGYWV